MTRIVKPELASDLTDLFPVLEPKSLSPDEVSATLQLTHPFLSGTHKFRDFRTQNISNVAGSAAAITFGPVPKDRYWYVHSISCQINVAVAVTRFLWFLLSGSKLPVSLGVGGQPFTLPVGAVGVAHSIPHALLLPETVTISAITSGVDATGVFQAVIAFHEHLLLEPSPNF